jgi:hypothetical protein
VIGPDGRPVQEAPQFDLDKALNTKDFMGFLAKFPDIKDLDMNNAEAIRPRFEAFTAKEKLKKDLRGLYGTHIQKEMGIKLEAAEVALLDAHWEKKAIENPESVLAMQSKLDQFEQLPREITRLQTEIMGMRGAPDILNQLNLVETQRDNLDLARGRMGVAGGVGSFLKAARIFTRRIKEGYAVRSVEYQDQTLEMAHEATKSKEALGQVKETYGEDITRDKAESLLVETRRNVTQLQAELERATAANTSLVDLQGRFTALRKELLGDVANIDGFAAALQAKVKAQLEGLAVAGASLKNLEQAQTRLDNLTKIKDSSETGINPLETVDTAAYSEDVNIRLAEETANAIIGEVFNADVAATGSLGKMEKAIMVFANKPKIGALTGSEMYEHIIGALEEATGSITGTTPEEIIRIKIVERIIGKVKAKADAAAATP